MAFRSGPVRDVHTFVQPGSNHPCHVAVRNRPRNLSLYANRPSSAVNGYFFIPNYPTVVAAINFDRTGTTHIGKYVLNHSFMMPGLVATGVSVALGLLMIQLF